MWNNNIERLRKIQEFNYIWDYLLNIAHCFEMSKQDNKYTFIDNHFFYGDKTPTIIKTIGICYKIDKNDILIDEKNFDNLNYYFQLPIWVFPVYNTLMQYKNQLYTDESKVILTTCNKGADIWGTDFNELKIGNILVQKFRNHDEITFILPIDIFIRVMIGVPTLQFLCYKII